MESNEVKVWRLIKAGVFQVCVREAGVRCGIADVMRFCYHF